MNKTEREMLTELFSQGRELWVHGKEKRRIKAARALAETGAVTIQELDGSFVGVYKVTAGQAQRAVVRIS